MQKRRFKFPKLCLSTILIEIGIICALVAVNTRPLSYGFDQYRPPSMGRLPGLGSSTNKTITVPPLTTNSDPTPAPAEDGAVMGPDSVLIKYTFLGDGDLDGDTDLGDDWNIRVANYGWPLKSVEIASETGEVHYVHKQRLAANLAICSAIVICSALAIEWSIRFANRAKRPIASIG